MSTQEWMWEFDMKLAENRKIQEAQEGRDGLPTSGDWARARKLHKEKMNRNG